MIDGDTLTVLRDGRDRVRGCLAFVDAPETGQDYGSRARQAACDLAFGQDVTIRELDRDRYGRTIAEVILPDGRSLGRELVAEGMAWDYRAYSHDPAMIQAEPAARAARAAHLGLWSQPNPIPPWDWRHGRNLPPAAEVVANRRSYVYHAPHCRAVAAMKAENRVEFKTAAAAEGMGYRRGKDCE